MKLDDTIIKEFEQIKEKISSVKELTNRRKMIEKFYASVMNEEPYSADNAHEALDLSVKILFLGGDTYASPHADNLINAAVGSIGYDPLTFMKVKKFGDLKKFGEDGERIEDYYKNKNAVPYFHHTHQQN